jgi:monoterpene epsilon-lactone hydrolase
MPPHDAQVRSVTVGSIPAEWVTVGAADVDLSAPILVHLHGGGYTIGSLETARPMAALLTAATGLPVLTVGYRLAPEHPYPAAVDDVVTLVSALIQRGVSPDNIVLCGESAGGGLVVAALLALRECGLPRVAGGVCLSPWFDLTLSSPSIERNAGHDPQAQPFVLKATAQQYLAGADPRTPLASPLFADLAGLPPLMIQAGAAEVLADDAVRLAQAAHDAGVDVECTIWPGMIHVWHSFAPRLPEAVSALDAVNDWLQWLLADTLDGARSDVDLGGHE